MCVVLIIKSLKIVALFNKTFSFIISSKNHGIFPQQKKSLSFLRLMTASNVCGCLPFSLLSFCHHKAEKQCVSGNYVWNISFANKFGLLNKHLFSILIKYTYK